MLYMHIINYQNSKKHKGGNDVTANKYFEKVH